MRHERKGYLARDALGVALLARTGKYLDQIVDDAADDGRRQNEQRPPVRPSGAKHMQQEERLDEGGQCDQKRHETISGTALALRVNQNSVDTRKRKERAHRLCEHHACRSMFSGCQARNAAAAQTLHRVAVERIDTSHDSAPAARARRRDSRRAMVAVVSIAQAEDALSGSCEIGTDRARTDSRTG